MPFANKRQMKYMFANHPEMAKKMADDAKSKGEPVVKPRRKGRRRIKSK